MFGTATANTIDVWLWPTTAAMLSAKSRPGTDNMMSVQRMMSESTQPPKPPASSPKKAPIAAPINSDRTPITSEALAP